MHFAYFSVYCHHSEKTALNAPRIEAEKASSLFHPGKRESRKGFGNRMNTNKKTHILILGGGFGGMYTAMHLDRTLARDPDIEVTLISQDNFFLFTPML